MTPQRVAVIISTWNRENFIVEAVNSALNQELPAGWELHVFVIDDGSTDNTLDMLVRHYALHATEAQLYEGGRLHLYTSENRERGATRNFGAALAARRFAPDWLIFLDSDDVLARCSVCTFGRRLEKVARPEEISAVYAKSRPWWGANRHGPIRKVSAVEGDIRWAILRETLFSIGTVMARATVFHAVGGFPEDRELCGSEDWVFHTRLALSGPAAYSDHVSALHRQHEGNTTPEQFLRSIVRTRTLFESELAEYFGGQAKQARRLMWQRAWLCIAGAFNSAGKSREAYVALSSCLRQNPSAFFDQRFWRISLSVLNRTVRNDKANPEMPRKFSKKYRVDDPSLSDHVECKGLADAEL
jgi:glycosyltransferase involved in cell wall biosynthesis